MLISKLLGGASVNGGGFAGHLQVHGVQSKELTECMRSS